MTRTATTRPTFHRARLIEVVETPPVEQRPSGGRRPPSLSALRDLVADVAASLATLHGDDAEARRRAQLLVDALTPIVRLPADGGATRGDPSVVTLREIHVLQRWLARVREVPQHEVVRAYARIETGLAGA